jgi:hypothetical protein
MMNRWRVDQLHWIILHVYYAISISHYQLEKFDNHSKQDENFIINHLPTTVKVLDDYCWNETNNNIENNLDYLLIE